MNIKTSETYYFTNKKMRIFSSQHPPKNNGYNACFVHKALQMHSLVKKTFGLYFQPQSSSICHTCMQCQVSFLLSIFVLPQEQRLKFFIFNLRKKKHRQQQRRHGRVCVYILQDYAVFSDYVIQNSSYIILVYFYDLS